jgi:hypothetical protein
MTIILNSYPKWVRLVSWFCNSYYCSYFYFSLLFEEYARVTGESIMYGYVHRIPQTVLQGRPFPLQKWLSSKVAKTHNTKSIERKALSADHSHFSEWLNFCLHSRSTLRSSELKKDICDALSVLIEIATWLPWLIIERGKVLPQLPSVCSYAGTGH